jgi:hypothetical protein
MFVFKKYDRQNHVWSFMTKYLRFLCKFTSWSGETSTGNFSDVFLSWTRIMSVLIIFLEDKQHFIVEKDTMGKKKTSQCIFLNFIYIVLSDVPNKISKFENRFPGLFKKYFRKSYPPLKSKKMSFCLETYLYFFNVMKHAYK